MKGVTNYAVSVNATNNHNVQTNNKPHSSPNIVTRARCDINDGDEKYSI